MSFIDILFNAEGRPNMPNGDQTVLMIIVVINNVTLNVYFLNCQRATKHAKGRSNSFDITVSI